jgi:hypothetical protein
MGAASMLRIATPSFNLEPSHSIVEAVDNPRRLSGWTESLLRATQFVAINVF